MRNATAKITAANALGKALGTPSGHAAPAGQSDGGGDVKISFGDTAKSQMSLLEKASGQPGEVLDPASVELAGKEEPKERT